MKKEVLVETGRKIKEEVGLWARTLLISPILIYLMGSTWLVQRERRRLDREIEEWAKAKSVTPR